jgi:hydroxymethylglutaryl-CoA lyase
MPGNDTVHIVETLRDAWQGLPNPVPTAHKIAFVQRLVDAGFPCLDIGSFVSRTKVPAMADTDELLHGITAPEGVVFTALVANARGLDRLLAVPAISEVLFPFSLSETFSRRNIGQTREESLAAVAELTARAHEAERTMYVTISMAFGNNEGDPYDVSELRDWIARLHAAGTDRVGLADTTAVATSQTIGEVYRAVAADDGPVPGAHLHVTPESQAPLVDAALDAGCRSFDAALGGLGGCQFAKGAVSNVSTLPLVRQLVERGLQPGLALDDLEVLDADARALAV